MTLMINMMFIMEKKKRVSGFMQKILILKNPNLNQNNQQNNKSIGKQKLAFVLILNGCQEYFSNIKIFWKNWYMVIVKKWWVLNNLLILFVA